MATLSPAFSRRRVSGIVRYSIAATFLFCWFYYLRLNNPPITHIQDYAAPSAFDPPADHLRNGAQSPIPNSQDHGDENRQSAESLPRPASDSDRPKTPLQKQYHPIDTLIAEADITFNQLLAKESKTVGAAAEAYRNRRGRHPPPGFDAWYHFAVKHDALVIEDFFDQIYHDLEPFWALDPALMRKEASAFDQNITVRDGFANTTSTWFWTEIWLDLVTSIQHLLPDMDIALNPMDEPRIIVPWEEMATYIQRAEQTRVMPRPQDVTSTFQRLPPPGQVEPAVKVRRKKWDKTKFYWKLARLGCPPDSPARTAPLQSEDSFAKPPTISMTNAEPHLRDGYVSNSSLAKEICHQPDLQGLNGIFIEPLSTSTTKVLFPLFGGSKLAINNEILIPAAMYWKDEERFTGGSYHGEAWSTKENGVTWRGVATGGRNRASNWPGFQRHRFVSMNNDTLVSRVEAGQWREANFALAEPAYRVAAQAAGKLGAWLKTWANVAFTEMMCDPAGEEADGSCGYTKAHFMVAQGLTMAQQFVSKYLPDVDGNSFSGRYLGFLRSTSVPIKATVWREWHDDRLVAWKHFVPMDSRLGDYYGIMEYFLGYGDEVAGHDEEGERIATAGKAWAEKVLRKEDMQVYTLRLLLEYARVVDDEREVMGWVEDLTAVGDLEVGA
ncbi:glycosyltransferase family 90 protein [Sodiomyces alcalophilus JCM 7366]|uniref:glycosyltransferase family 90 protein n=1 Tax=Sodiomyces alcalophilus JCM 7366 TaxID=591952 RepID=UPI0039B62083